MHRIVVVVFDNEAEAAEGRNKLLQLDNQGSIGMYGYAVLAKKADGAVLLRQMDSHGTLSPFANSLLASLCDSACFASESVATHAGESAADSNKTNKAESFIRDAVEVLLPGRVAIVLDVEEEWPHVLDRAVEPIGGVIFRWDVSEVQHAIGV